MAISIKELTDNINKRVPVKDLKLKKEEIYQASILSKLVTTDNSKTNFKNNKPEDKYKNLKADQLLKIVKDASDRIKSNEDIFTLFPDIDIAVQTMVSVVLSPKDMTTTQYNLVANKKLKKYPSNVVNAVIEIIKEELESFYKLKSELATIIETALFKKGSYFKVILPESKVDYLINKNNKVTLEDLSEIIDVKSSKVKNIGFIGKKSINSNTTKSNLNSAFESIKVNNSKDINLEEYFTIGNNVSNVSITDNYNVLKLPKLIQQAVREKTKSIIRKTINTENYKDNNFNENILYRTVNKDNVPVEIITPDKDTRASIGRPLVLNIPSESVIPIHVPSEPSNHIGYLVLLDEEGNPISYLDKTIEPSFTTTSNGDKNNEGVSNFLLEKARNNLYTYTKDEDIIKGLTEIYSSQIEGEIIERLKNGNFTRDFIISKRDSVFRIMMARTLANQETKILFLPAELANYFAYDYYENGTGKSLYDNIRVLLSIRAILLFAKINALSKNSIAITKVNLTLDPDDPDPMKTIEEAMHEVLRTRQQFLPIGVSSPIDLAEWTQRAGLEFTFEGHPDLPGTKLDFETNKMNFEVPDSELEEDLYKQTIMALGLSPETINMGMSPEFATTVVENNILLTKRINLIQSVFEPQITKYINSIFEYDVFIRNKIIKILKDNEGELKNYFKSLNEDANTEISEINFDELYTDVVSSISFEFIKADSITTKNQKEAFDEYKEALDLVVDLYVSPETLNKLAVEDLTDNVDEFKEMLKSYFLRKYVSEKGFINEIGLAVTNDENTDAVINEILKHNENMSKFILTLMNNSKELKKVIKADLGNLQAYLEDTGEEETTEEESDESTLNDFEI